MVKNSSCTFYLQEFRLYVKFLQIRWGSTGRAHAHLSHSQKMCPESKYVDGFSRVQAFPVQVSSQRIIEDLAKTVGSTSSSQSPVEENIANRKITTTTVIHWYIRLIYGV